MTACGGTGVGPVPPRMPVIRDSMSRALDWPVWVRDEMSFIARESRDDLEQAVRRLRQCWTLLSRELYETGYREADSLTGHQLKPRVHATPVRRQAGLQQESSIAGILGRAASTAPASWISAGSWYVQK